MHPSLIITTKMETVTNFFSSSKLDKKILQCKNKWLGLGYTEKENFVCHNYEKFCDY